MAIARIRRVVIQVEFGIDKSFYENAYYHEFVKEHKQPCWKQSSTLSMVSELFLTAQYLSKTA